MELTPFILRLIIKEAAELGATCALIRSDNLKPYLNKSEAFRAYGRKNIENWIREGLITVRKDGNHSAAWRLDRIELENLSKSFKLFQLISL